MVKPATTCPHPAGSRYWDLDEERCRLCSQSITYPAREPGPQDKRGYIPPVEPVEKTLLCTCCHQILPLDAFGLNRAASHREQRAYACRVCAAFRQRMKRKADGPAVRKRDRSRMRAYLDKPEKRAAHNETVKTHRETQNAAGRRRNARDKGIPVPIQRAGRAPIYLKQVCRISENCPLREFCTTENKGLE